jgi:uncharacterized protein (DUF433 family)
MLEDLVGIGIYTTAEAGRLLHIAPSTLARWIRGHQVGKTFYAPLWKPQISLGEGQTFLGFRDLLEARIANRFIQEGMSAQRVRAGITLAREVIGQERPLSSYRFRTDGREIFLKILSVDEEGEPREQLLNLFKRQYEFKQIIDPLLKDIDFADGEPALWWPRGKRVNIVVDPARAFGQPIDAGSSVPTRVLAAAAATDGEQGAARAYEVPLSAVRRALRFEAAMA